MANAMRLYRAVVVSTLDPEGLGRVKLATPRVVRGSPVQVEGWATVGATPLGAAVMAKAVYADGDVVLYAAERLPFVNAVLLCRIGGPAVDANLAAPPIQIPMGQGHQATVEAVGGALRVSTTAGQQVNLLPSGAIEVTSPAAVAVSAAQCTLSAGMLVVDAGMSKFSGVVKCDTLITNSVISASYTPGAGNIY